MRRSGKQETSSKKKSNFRGVPKLILKTSLIDSFVYGAESAIRIHTQFLNWFLEFTAYQNDRKAKSVILQQASN
jgi:hypothetical protein